MKECGRVAETADRRARRRRRRVRAWVPPRGMAVEVVVWGVGFVEDGGGEV